jgi:hypothetical protein
MACIFFFAIWYKKINKINTGYTYTACIFFIGLDEKKEKEKDTG